MKPGHEANRAGPHSSLQFVPLGGALGLEIGCRPGDEDGRALSRKMVRDAKGAPWFYGRSDMTFRIGNGFDVHAFGPGDHVTLCGIRIPHAAGLVGHSDADVAMHTVTDAVYGALAMGDIGTHFPPSDPQWRGAASEIFLRHAVALARENGFRPGNVDCTIICETPKIAPYAVKMRENMASLMELGPDLISVKATTSERLGFTGRGEGIACIATCLLMAT